MRYILLALIMLMPFTSQAKDLPFVLDNSHEISASDKKEMIKIMKAHAKKGQYLFFVTEEQLPKEEYATSFFKNHKISKEIKEHSFLLAIFKKEHRIQGEPGQKLPKRFISGKALDSVFSETTKLNLMNKKEPSPSAQAVNFVKAYFKVLDSDK